MKEESMNVTRRGAYSYPTSATLLGVTSETVRRWSNGYTRKVNYGEGRKRFAPVLQTEHEAGYVDFLELVELIYCREFRAHNVPLANIREAAEILSRKVGPFPFASQELLVAVRRLVEDAGLGLVLDVASRQLMVRLGDLIKPQVVYDRDGRIGRFFVANETTIFLDPKVRFGEPVLASRPVPVQTIAKLYRAESGNVESVADYFHIAEREVTAAVAFQADPRLAVA